MNLIVKYTATNLPAVAQMPADGTAQGNAGVNFIGASTNIAMTLANPVGANNSDKGIIVPTTNNISTGTYVDKIVSLQLPALMDATAITYLSASLSKVGINTDVVGIEVLGLNRTEVAGVTAAFAKNVTLEANIGTSVSNNRLLVTIGTAVNAIQGSTLNLRITYKN